MGRLIDDKDRAAVKRLHAKGQTRNDIARAIKRSPSTVSKIAGQFEPPLTFDRAPQVKAATSVRTADLAARRAALALQDDAELDLVPPSSAHSRRPYRVVLQLPRRLFRAQDEELEARQDTPHGGPPVIDGHGRCALGRKPDGVPQDSRGFQFPGCRGCQQWRPARLQVPGPCCKSARPPTLRHQLQGGPMPQKARTSEPRPSGSCPPST